MCITSSAKRVTVTGRPICNEHSLPVVLGLTRPDAVLLDPTRPVLKALLDESDPRRKAWEARQARRGSPRR